MNNFRATFLSIKPKIAKQAASNKLLAKILANPESKEALMKVLEGSLEELEKSEGNNKIG